MGVHDLAKPRIRSTSVDSARAIDTSSFQNWCPPSFTSRRNISTASCGVRASSTTLGFDEILTKPLSVIEQLAQPCAWFFSNQARARRWWT